MKGLHYLSNQWAYPNDAMADLGARAVSNQLFPVMAWVSGSKRLLPRIVQLAR
jgi:hypothetical protein